MILKPTEGQEFSGGPGLPAGWSSTPWGAGGSASVSGGSMHVDGALAGTTATFTPGHSLDFSATFGADAFQHVALTDNFNNAWAMFSTRSSTSQLYASTNASDTGGIQDTPVGAPNQYVGSQHLYRIQWDASQVQYYIDGTLVHTQAATFTQNLNIATSDFNVGGPELSVDWLHLGPYPASGTFDSRVFDAGPGQSVDWGALSWNSATPSGTGLAISVRTGDTPAPDGTWSAFTPIATSGGDIPGNSRYLQYRAALSTTDPNLTPTLSDVTVNGAGDIPPTAVDDTKTVAEDSGATAIDVLANDTNPDGGPKTIASVTQPAHGTVAITGGGSGLTYQPNPNYCNDGSPTDDFTYTLNGGSTATVAVTVTCAVDNPPVAVDDTKTVAEDSGATAIDVLANDTDPDGGPKAIASVTQPAHGTVAVAPDNLSLTYTPNPNYCNGGSPTDDFTYTLNGGSTATVGVTVTCVDDNPTAVDDIATVSGNSGPNPIDVLANDTDPDGGPKTIASVTQPAHGTVAITGGGSGLTYQPNANYCNNPPAIPTDNFTYTLSPGGSTATVAITVDCSTPPVAVDDTKTVAEDSSATQINVLANDTDVDGGDKTIASVTQPAHGTVAVAPDNLSLTYTPNPNYCNDGSPTDDFTYTLNGGSTATVAVTVTCVDDNPTAVNDTKTVAEDSGATAIDVLANDTDPDGGPKTIASVTQPAHGTVAVTRGGSGLTYTAEPELLQRRQPDRRLHLHPERRLDRDRGGHGELRDQPPERRQRLPGRRRDRRFSQWGDVRHLQQGDGQAHRRGRLLAQAKQRRGAGERQLRLVRERADLRPQRRPGGRDAVHGEHLDRRQGPRRQPAGGREELAVHDDQPPEHRQRLPGRRCDRRFSQWGDVRHLQQGDGQAHRRGRLLAEAKQRRGAGERQLRLVRERAHLRPQRRPGGWDAVHGEHLDRRQGPGREPAGGREDLAVHDDQPPEHRQRLSGRRCDRRFSQWGDVRHLQQGDGQAHRRGRLLAQAKQRRGAGERQLRLVRERAHLRPQRRPGGWDAVHRERFDRRQGPGRQPAGQSGYLELYDGSLRLALYRGDR